MTSKQDTLCGRTQSQIEAIGREAIVKWLDDRDIPAQAHLPKNKIDTVFLSDYLKPGKHPTRDPDLFLRDANDQKGTSSTYISWM